MVIVPSSEKPVVDNSKNDSNKHAPHVFTNASVVIIIEKVIHYLKNNRHNKTEDY